MDIELSRCWTTRWEGRRAVAYDDATGEPIRPGAAVIGNPTIGVGLDLNTAEARSMLARLDLDFARVIAGAIALTDAQINQLLDWCIENAASDARSLVVGFDTLDDDVQLVLVDLSFNMGKDRLAEFHDMLRAAEARNRTAAAAALIDSKWYGEVGKARNERGGADVAVLGGHAQPEEILALG